MNGANIQPYVLYSILGCPYSAEVKNRLKWLRLAFEERDIRDPLLKAELVTLSGRSEAPYLYDPNHHVGTSRAERILAYLERHAPTAS